MQYISPDDGSALFWDDQSQCYFSADRRFRYECVDKVPVLLPQDATQLADQAQQHAQFDSHFHYLDHYQKDAALFDYFAGPTDGATQHENQRLHETIAREVPQDKGRILDVGCGSAWVAARFCPLGQEVYSFDVSLANTRKAIKKHPFPNHQAIVGDVFHLPFGKNMFDCIIASEIIEHVTRPAIFIEKLLQVLKPGGKLIVTTPYDERIVYYLCIHCNRPTPQHAHLHSFDQQGIRKLVPSAVQQGTRTQVFSNKFLLKLRTYVLLRWLPYVLWWGVDRMANKLLGKPTRLMLLVEDQRRTSE